MFSYALVEDEHKPQYTDDDLSDRGAIRKSYETLQGSERGRGYVCFISVAVNLILFAFSTCLAVRLHRIGTAPNPFDSNVYSPAQGAVTYVVKTFVDGLETPAALRPVYLGPPTNETDAAWQELYDVGGISSISSEEAARLSEPTAKVLDEPASYFLGLDVFHQLHCLNWVRMALRPERYQAFSLEGLNTEQREERMMHIDHCIDSIRQSLMCSGDVSPVIWKWRKDRGLVQEMNNTHVCRDFDSINEWAKAHMLTRPINSKLPEDRLWDIVDAASE